VGRLLAIDSWIDDGNGALMNRNRLLAILAITTLIGVSAFAQAHRMPHRTSKPMKMHAAEPMMDCEAMMKKHGEMQAKHKEMDARLDQLVAAMNQADGQAKVERMAAVVNELAAQRSQMRDHMAGMMPMMMQHMGGHMQHGADAVMAECPMMKMMHAAEEKPASPAAHEH
jgi:hypothetical protein